MYRKENAYKAYIELVKWIPELWGWLVDPNNAGELEGVVKQVSIHNLFVNGRDNQCHDGIPAD